MVSSRITKAVLAVAFALMPLQGVAQTLAMLICLPHMAQHDHEISPASHPHGDANHAHPHDHHAGAQHDPSHDGTASSNHSDHFCCHIVAPGLPAIVHPIAVLKFSSPALSPGVFHYTTFLKLPQRPPLV